MYGHDAAHTSYNPVESVLNAGNVATWVPRWQVDLGGDGAPPSGGPVVAGGRVFAGSSAATGANYFAFDAVSGAAAWSANLGHMTSCFGVGIGATAAVSGSLLVAGGGDAAYYGVDAASGAILWRHPLDVGPSGFAWASPLLAHGRAYLGVASDCDNPSVRGAVRAVDLASGTLLASQAFVPDGQAGAGIWNSPALNPHGDTLVLASGEDYGGYDGPYNRAMLALDPLTLQISAAHKQGATSGDQDFATSPVIFPDRHKRTLVAANHKDGTFYAYDSADIGAGPVWHVVTGFTAGMMPAYDPSTGDGGTLFIVDQDGTIQALDPDTGGRRWQRAVGTSLYGNLALANGLVFANAGAGGLVVLDAASGVVLRTLLPDHAGGSYSGVAVAGGFVYWIASTHLNAWSLPGPAPTPAPPTPTVLPSTPTVGPGCAFSDVCPGAYYYGPVQYLASQGAISGYGDQTFRPFNSTTRGQLVKIVATAFHLPVYAPAVATFADVPAGSPFFVYVESAAQAGVISGYADATFRPGNAVTRGQVAKIIVAAAGWALRMPPVAGFADVPPADPAFPFVETAACHGIISGYTCGGPEEPCVDGSRPYFRPGAAATRGQIAKIVYGAVLPDMTCAPARR